MERKAEQERMKRYRKESSHGRTDSAKGQRGSRKVSRKLVNTADKKAKEAEKQKDSTAMKPFLVESNAADLDQRKYRRKKFLVREGNQENRRKN